MIEITINKYVIGIWNWKTTFKKKMVIDIYIYIVDKTKIFNKYKEYPINITDYFSILKHLLNIYIQI